MWVLGMRVLKLFGSLHPHEAGGKNSGQRQIGGFVSWENEGEFHDDLNGWNHTEVIRALSIGVRKSLGFHVSEKLWAYATGLTIG